MSTVNERKPAQPQDAAVGTDAPVQVLDCLGLFCPMPVLRLAGAMRVVQLGDEVELLADDPASRVDVPVWCRTRDQELLSVTDRPEGGWTYRVRRVR